MAKVLDSGVRCEPLIATNLPAEFRKKAMLELNEDPETRDRKIQKLREMIQDEGSHLVSRSDDNFLLRFLRARKFNCPRALDTVKNYYSYRTRYKDVMTNFLPSSVEHVYRLNLANILPYRDPQGNAIAVLRCNDVDVTTVPFLDALSAALMTIEKAIEFEATQINGFVCLADMQGFAMQHLNYMGTTTNAFMIISLLQNCFPARLKAIHVIHEPPIFKIFFNGLKVLMKDKIRSRIHFHKNDLHSLYQHLPAAILPEEYGGQLGAFDNSDWFSTLLASETTFADSRNYGYSELD